MTLAGFEPDILSLRGLSPFHLDESAMSTALCFFLRLKRLQLLTPWRRCICVHSTIPFASSAIYILLFLQNYIKCNWYRYWDSNSDAHAAASKTAVSAYSTISAYSRTCLRPKTIGAASRILQFLANLQETHISRNPSYAKEKFLLLFTSLEFKAMKGVYSFFRQKRVGMPSIKNCGLNEGSRTPDLMLPRHALYQLSYIQIYGRHDRTWTYNNLRIRQVLSPIELRAYIFISFFLTLYIYYI